MHGLVLMVRLKADTTEILGPPEGGRHRHCAATVGAGAGAALPAPKPAPVFRGKDVMMSFSAILIARLRLKVWRNKMLNQTWQLGVLILASVAMISKLYISR